MYEIITEKTLSEYEAFVQSHPKGNFAQSFLWGKQKPMWRWQAVAVRGSDGKIKGTLALMTRPVPVIGRTLMYGCRGPVCDLDDRETLAELIEGAKALAKENRAYVIKIDPDVPSSNTQFAGLLHELGFRGKEGGKNFEAIQPRYVFRLNVEGKTEDELLAGFHQKWRYNIRLAERKGVTVRVCGKEMVPAFSELMLTTGVRDGFVTRKPEYFAAMLDNLGEHCRLYMAFDPAGTPIAGTLAIHYGDKVWYLYGASSNEHRNLMPNYLLQWRMIQWAVETGCRVYDFRGVSGDVSEDNPLYGLYRFKQGFGGEFTEFIGELDLVLSPVVYWCVEHGTSIFKELRRRLYLIKNRNKSPEQEAAR
ncbi:MAG: peptidoglycan bridge formation glycyltransferase FemA/FemB family protein [Clostridiales bacterium]|nr:peptidoglycan bridge formation glycyltransferase FemA/FemB family protein [Clostridiales bacterium]